MSKHPEITFASGEKLKNDEADFFASSKDNSSSNDGIRVKFLGTNSIFITDGITNLIIDPYFSRPDVRWTGKLMPNVYAEIKPDKNMIKEVLKRADIESLHAILITHSHFDHALDIAEIANTIKSNDHDYPSIVGSKSVFNVAVSGGIPASAIRIIPEKKDDLWSKTPIQFGDFNVTFIRGEHISTPVVGPYLAGEIKKPFSKKNIQVRHFKEGGIYNIFIEHTHGTILNLGSAGFIKGRLKYLIEEGNLFNYLDKIGMRKKPGKNNIDALIISVGGLEKYSQGIHIFKSIFDYATFGIYYHARDRSKYISKFYREAVRPVGPKQIFLTHWDNFYRSLFEEMKWFYEPKKSLEFLRTMGMEYIGQTGEATICHLQKKVPVKFLPIWEEIQILPVADEKKEGNRCLEK